MKKGGLELFCYAASARRANVTFGAITCALDPHRSTARNQVAQLIQVAARKLQLRLARPTHDGA